MTLPNTVSEYSQYAAQQFLQTVVFIDDQIYKRKSGAVHESSKLTAPQQRKKVSKTSKQQSVVSPPVDIEDNEELGEYSPYDVVTSFAKKQIICSLYQPKKRAKVTQESDIFPLCKAADVVIIDWNLNDTGEKALELIDGLITQAVVDVPEQLRLILVYTLEYNLQSIANRVYEKVVASIGEQFVPLPEENGLAFHTGNSRISILGKPTRERLDTPQEHIVEEKDLANVVVNEFAKLTSGLLHAASLLGLAEIRKNSRKILSKFNSSLDSAFLTHRALSLPDEDAANHLIPLLISEIEAVLKDKLHDPIISKSLIEDWCSKVWKPGTHVVELLGKQADPIKIATDFCLKGKEMRQDHISVPLIKQSISNKGEWNNDRRKFRDITSLLTDTKESIANHEFSRLMSSRTFYGKGAKSLQLGTIVYLLGKNDSKTFLLCLMPICDSVRLSEPRKFVFVELEESEQNGDSKASIALMLSANSPLELIYKPKSYITFISEFHPDKSLKQVLTKKSDNGIEIFKDVEGREFIWVDQLKTAHAQRAVEQFARELSRVGLTESEWQRLLDK